MNISYGQSDDVLEIKVPRELGENLKPHFFVIFCELLKAEAEFILKQATDREYIHKAPVLSDKK